MELTSWGLLAQAETAEAPKAAADAGADQAQTSPFGSLLVPLTLIMVMFYFLILRPQPLLHPGITNPGRWVAHCDGGTPRQFAP